MNRLKVYEARIGIPPNAPGNKHYEANNGPSAADVDLENEQTERIWQLRPSAGPCLVHGSSLFVLNIKLKQRINGAVAHLSSSRARICCATPYWSSYAK